MAEQRPKIEFLDNVQVDVKMKFSECYRQGENNGRPWYLWTVEDNDGDASLFADEPLQMLLEAADIERGDEVSIKAVKTSKTEPKTWHVWVNNQAVSLTGPKKQQQEQQQEPPKEPPKEQQQEPQQEQQETPKEPPKRAGDLTYSDRVNLMGACIQDAALIWTAVKSEGDNSRAIAAIANTLFIDCRKDRSIRAPDYSEPDTSGVTSDPDIQEGDPGYGEPPNPGTDDDDDLPF
jgi:hypothetical protein